MAQDATQGQQAFMRSIDEYIDRHAHTGSSPKDLDTLQSINARGFYSGNDHLI